MSRPPFVSPPDHVSAERFTLPDGATLAVWRAAPWSVVAGQASRGTILLVPGWTGSKEDFISIFAPLSERGWEVLSYDQRGQHESDSFDQEADYSLAGFAADLAAFAAAQGTGAPVHLVGHSFGGLVSQRAVASGMAVSSLTLMCTGPGALNTAEAAAVGEYKSVMAEHGPHVLWEGLQERALARGELETDEQVAEFLRTRHFASSPAGLMAKAHILMSAPDIIDDVATALSAAGRPSLVMFGELDDAWPLEWQVTMGARLGAEVVELPGAGHSPAVEDPAATVELLDRFCGAAVS